MFEDEYRSMMVSSRTKHINFFLIATSLFLSVITWWYINTSCFWFVRGNLYLFDIYWIRSGYYTLRLYCFLLQSIIFPVFPGSLFKKELAHLKWKYCHLLIISFHGTQKNKNKMVAHFPAVKIMLGGSFTIKAS